MSADIASTNYAVSHNLGYEANGFMSGIILNQILFILTKLIGSLVIIMIFSKCLEKSKKITYIGMRLIVFIMLFVVANNLLVINAAALSFSNLSVGGTGAINTGNGYFDDPNTQFLYTGNRNIYVVSEDTAIWILEPISYASSGSQAVQLINSSFGTIKDAVVHNGYLYYIDGTTLKKRGGHSNTNLCESNDTSAGGCITTITTNAGSSSGATLRVYNNRLYFFYQTAIYYLDDLDNVVTSTTLMMPYYHGGAVANHISFGVGTYQGTTVIYATGSGTVGAVNQYVVYRCTNTCTAISASYGLNTVGMISRDTFFSTSNYEYMVIDPSVTVAANESLIYTINNTFETVNYLATDSIGQPNRVYVGGQSTVGLLAASATTYETFNAIETGTDSLPVVPSELTYDTKTIESLDAIYYNRSDIYLQYNVIINSLNVNNLLLDFEDYRWMIVMTDPNGVSQDIVQTPKCLFSSVLDTTCQITSTMGIHSPSNGWLNGTWHAKLYEMNIITGAPRALIATSSSFTVLNTSLENQSIIPLAFEPSTSGTAPQAISLIDGFVSWLGMGVNSVSKLLFAMIIIAIAATVGLGWGNGNIAMVFAFVPYAFFTYIDYIPKWIFIITILLIAIESKLFR